MHHTMTNPCQHCPFRNDLGSGYLTAARVTEITQSLFQGFSFPCHETTVPVDGDDGESDMEETPDSQQCAGAEIFLAHQGASTQMGRIAERLGFPVSKLNMDSPVCRTLDELQQMHS